jgi:CubicO group peptidase (beta-lactamase class C family)
MKTGMKRLAAILLCILFMATGPVRAFALSSDGTLPSGISRENIDREIEDYVAAHAETTAGMAVSVFDRSTVIYRNYFGFSDVEKGISVDENTVFEWGSATKILVWVSVMQLVEQGKLELEADLRQYLPEGFLRNLTFDVPVTMLNLMNHDAGFEETLVGMFTHREDRILSLEDYLVRVQPRQVFAPGTVTAYSNWGVTLAGYLVERISGMPFYEYAQTNIFAPLGMTHSALNSDLSDNPWVKEQRAQLQCYTTEAVLIPNCMVYFSMYPAGTCTSTLKDFETFGKALLNRESPLFQDPATYDSFLEPTAYFGDTNLSLNHHGLWAIRMYDASVIGHGGNTAGCSSYLLLDPENGIGMTVMTNQAGEQIFNRKMPELIFGRYQGESLDFTGYVLNARTIYRGPLKLYQLLSMIHMTPETTAGTVSILTNQGGMEKITAPYGDYLVTTLPELLVQCLPLIFWVLGLAFCFLNLFFCGIAGFIRRLRRRMPKRPVKKWTIAACVLQILPLIPVIPAVITFFNWKQWPLWQYDAVFGAFLVWAAVYAVLTVHGIREMVRSRRADAYTVAVVLSLTVSIVNILYWELGAFWRM